MSLLSNVPCQLPMLTVVLLQFMPLYRNKVAYTSVLASRTHGLV